MSLQVGVENPPPSAPSLDEVTNAPLALPERRDLPSARECEAIGDGLLESMFNPNCGLDIYETCDENTWVDCRVASSRLGFYVFAAIVVIVLLIIFFATDGVGKFIVILVAVGLFLLSRFGTSWIEKSARTEYQRMNKEIEGIMRSGDFSRKEALLQLRDEKLRRETNAAMRSHRGAPAETGLAAGIATGLVTGLMNRRK